MAGGGAMAAGGAETAGIDGLEIRPGGGGGGVATRARCSTGGGVRASSVSRVSMLISPYSSSSIAAVGNEAATRWAGATEPASKPACPPTPTPRPSRSVVRSLSRNAFVSQGFVRWPLAPAFCPRPSS